MMPAAHRSPPRQQTEDGVPSPREAASPLCAPRARAATTRGGTLTRSRSRSPAASPHRARAVLAASAPGMLPLFPSAPGNLGLYGNGVGAGSGGGSSRAHASAAAAQASTGQTHGSAGDPRSVLLVKWLDYSSKYGLSYLLSNGTVGMVFRDGSQMVHEKGTTWAWFYSAPSSQEVQKPHPDGHRGTTAASGLSYLGPAPPGHTSSSSSAVTAAGAAFLRPAVQNSVQHRQQQPGVQPQALPADVEELAELEAAAAQRRRHGGNGAVAGASAVGGRGAGVGHAGAAARGSASSSHELTKKLKLLLGFQKKMLDKPGRGGGGGGGGVQGVQSGHGLREGREELGGEEEDDEDVAQRRVLQRRRPLGVHGPPPEVRVVSWARTHKALVVCLSSGTVQGLFADGSEVVMREADDEVMFLARDGRRHACSLRGVRQAGARHSITKRLDYMALLLQQAASTAAATAAGAAAAAGGAR